MLSHKMHFVKNNVCAAGNDMYATLVWLYKRDAFSCRVFHMVSMPLFLVWLQVIENWHWYFTWTE